MVAFDEDINWATCDNDGGEACPGISWAVVSDDERGDVLEVTHAETDKLAAIFTKTSTALDLSAYAENLEFDIKIISGDNNMTMKVDCVYPVRQVIIF